MFTIRNLAALATTAALSLAVSVAIPELNSRPSPSDQRVPPSTQQPQANLEPTPITDATGSVPAALTRGVALINNSGPDGNSAGTGMVLTADGQVLTNYHVVAGTTAVTVTIADTGQSYAATVLGHDAVQDVALLQLADATNLDPVTLDDDGVTVADTLTVVGNANGGGELVAAQGTVTGVDQSVTVRNRNDLAELTGVIETNADAEPGDSGGPMFDSEGEVSGMTTAGSQTYAQTRRGQATTQTETTSLAVPIEDAMAVVTQIRAGIERDTVTIGPAAYLGLSVAPGLQVIGVATGSGADAAGIPAAATLVGIGDTALATQADLAEALTGFEPGDTVSVTWLTPDHEARSAEVTLGESPVN
ncbi:MAG: S1C family serine protease [Propioniciclava sp.]